VRRHFPALLGLPLWRNLEIRRGASHVAQLVPPEARTWIGRSEPPVTVCVTRRDIRKYAVATRQSLRKYVDGDEAPPLFHFYLFRDIVSIEQMHPDGMVEDPLIPGLPLKRVLFGGQETTYHRMIRPGDVLVGTRTLQDIYEKSGSSGPLIFVVTELNVETEAGDPVLTEASTLILR